MTKLGGWTRLWIVTTIAWAMAVGYFAYSNWPNRDHYKAQAAATAEAIAADKAITADLAAKADAIAASLADMDVAKSAGSNDTAYVAAIARTAALAHEAAAKSANASRSAMQAYTIGAGANDDPAIETEYQKALHDAWLSTLGFLLLPPLLVAGIGLASSWIFRGFGSK